MSAARLVDEQILAAFDRATAEYAPAVRQRLLHPGLSELEIRAQFATIGVEPSEEALAWWRYFDRPRQVTAPFPMEVLPDFQFASVAMSVEAYGHYRRMAEENAEPAREPEEAWATEWIPNFGTDGSGVVVLDCRARPPGHRRYERFAPTRSTGPTTPR